MYVRHTVCTYVRTYVPTHFGSFPLSLFVCASSLCRPYCGTNSAHGRIAQGIIMFVRGKKCLQTFTDYVELTQKCTPVAL